MKKQILSIALGFAALMIVSTTNAAAKASTSAKNGYTVHSVKDGRDITTAFNKKGSWLYTIQQYSKDNLDKRIVDKVHDVYANYGVTAIEKVDQPGFEPVYVVRLENTASLKMVRISNGDVELVQDFVKG